MQQVPMVQLVLKVISARLVLQVTPVLPDLSAPRAIQVRQVLLVPQALPGLRVI